MWWEQATTPGRIPSVTHARLTRWPLSVSTRTRSPLRTPIRAASSGWIQTGLAWAISLSHFALPVRVWTSTGRRNVGMSAKSFGPVIRSRATWLTT